MIDPIFAQNTALLENTLGNCMLQLPKTHPSYAGHFPGYPIVPGVLSLELVIGAVCDDLSLSSSAIGLDVSGAKFTAPVFPGESLIIHYRVKPKAASSEHATPIYLVSIEAFKVKDDTVHQSAEKVMSFNLALQASIFSIRSHG